MSALHSITLKDFPYRYKFYLSSLNLCDLSPSQDITQLLTLGADGDVMKAVPIFDINNFKLKDSTGSVTFTKPDGDIVVDLSDRRLFWTHDSESNSYYTKNSNADMSYLNSIVMGSDYSGVNSVNGSIILNNKNSSFYEDAVLSDTVMLNSKSLSNAASYSNCVYINAEPSFGSLKNYEIAIGGRGRGSGTITLGDVNVNPLTGIRYYFENLHQQIDDDGGGSKIVCVSSTGLLHTIEVPDGGDDGPITTVIPVIAAVGGALLGVLFAKKRTLGGLFDGLFGSSTPNVPKIQVNDSAGVENVMFEGVKKGSKHELSIPDNYDTLNFGDYVNNPPQYDDYWGSQYAALQAVTNEGAFAGPAEALLNSPNGVQLITHQGGVLTRLAGPRLAQQLSHALTLDRTALRHLLFVGGLVVGGAVGSFGRVKLHPAGPGDSDVLIPSGESTTFSTSNIGCVCCEDNVRTPVMLSDKRTGMVNYAEFCTRQFKLTNRDIIPATFGEQDPITLTRPQLTREIVREQAIQVTPQYSVATPDSQISDVSPSTDSVTTNANQTWFTGKTQHVRLIETDEDGETIYMPELPTGANSNDLMSVASDGAVQRIPVAEILSLVTSLEVDPTIETELDVVRFDASENKLKRTSFSDAVSEIHGASAFEPMRNLLTRASWDGTDVVISAPTRLPDLPTGINSNDLMSVDSDGAVQRIPVAEIISLVTAPEVDPTIETELDVVRFDTSDNKMKRTSFSGAVSEIHGASAFEPMRDLLDRAAWDGTDVVISSPTRLTGLVANTSGLTDFMRIDATTGKLIRTPSTNVYSSAYYSTLFAPMRNILDRTSWDGIDIVITAPTRMTGIVANTSESNDFMRIEATTGKLIRTPSNNVYGAVYNSTQFTVMRQLLSRIKTSGTELNMSLLMEDLPNSNFVQIDYETWRVRQSTAAQVAQQILDAQPFDLVRQKLGWLTGNDATNELTLGIGATGGGVNSLTLGSATTTAAYVPAFKTAGSGRIVVVDPVTSQVGSIASVPSSAVTFDALPLVAKTNGTPAVNIATSHDIVLLNKTNSTLARSSIVTVADRTRDYIASEGISIASNKLQVNSIAQFTTVPTGTMDMMWLQAPGGVGQFRRITLALVAEAVRNRIRDNLVTTLTRTNVSATDLYNNYRPGGSRRVLVVKSDGTIGTERLVVEDGGGGSSWGILGTVLGGIGTIGAAAVALKVTPSRVGTSLTPDLPTNASISIPEGASDMGMWRADDGLYRIGEEASQVLLDPARSNSIGTYYDALDDLDSSSHSILNGTIQSGRVTPAVAQARSGFFDATEFANTASPRFLSVGSNGKLAQVPSSQAGALSAQSLTAGNAWKTKFDVDEFRVTKNTITAGGLWDSQTKTLSPPVLEKNELEFDLQQIGAHTLKVQGRFSAVPVVRTGRNMELADFCSWIPSVTASASNFFENLTIGEGACNELAINTTQRRNVVIGANAGSSTGRATNSQFRFNTVVGVYAMANKTTGNSIHNVVVGCEALANPGTSDSNVVVGSYGLNMNSTGIVTRCVVIGNDCYRGTAAVNHSFANCVLIDVGTRATTGNVANQIVIGRAVHTSCELNGIWNNPSTSVQRITLIDSDNRLRSITPANFTTELDIQTKALALIETNRVNAALATYRTIATSYSKTETDSKFRTITDSYSKGEVDGLFSSGDAVIVDTDDNLMVRRDLFPRTGASVSRVYITDTGDWGSRTDNTVFPGNLEGTNRSVYSPPYGDINVDANTIVGINNHKGHHGRNVVDNVCVGVDNWARSTAARAEDSENNITVGNMNCFGLIHSKHNIVIGRSIFRYVAVPLVDSLMPTVTNCIAIGVGTEENSRLNPSGITPATVQDLIILGNSTHKDFICKAARLSGQSGSMYLYVNAAGLIRPIASSERYKTNIEYITDDEIDAFESLAPKSYVYKDPGEGTDINYGLIAEDVHEKMPALCSYANGIPESVKYHHVPALLAASNKRLRSRVASLESEVDSLKSRLEKIEAALLA